jgi:hypothetical protein
MSKLAEFKCGIYKVLGIQLGILYYGIAPSCLRWYWVVVQIEMWMILMHLNTRSLQPAVTHNVPQSKHNSLHHSLCLEDCAFIF